MAARTKRVSVPQRFSYLQLAAHHGFAIRLHDLRAEGFWLSFLPSSLTPPVCSGKFPP
jgi:hypothetical protein